MNLKNWQPALFTQLDHVMTVALPSRPACVMPDARSCEAVTSIKCFYLKSSDCMYCNLGLQ